LPEGLVALLLDLRQLALYLHELVLEAIALLLDLSELALYLHELLLEAIALLLDLRELALEFLLFIPPYCFRLFSQLSL
jgi:hypothetical protein